MGQTKMTESEKSIIVTGASSGIGQAVCQKLLQQGYEVVGIARDFSKCSLDDERFHSHVIDMSVPDQLEAQISDVLDKTESPIRALVNNAGIGKMGHLEQLSVSDIQVTLNTNFLAHAIVTKKLLPRLKKQPSLSDIVFVGSEAALRGAQQGSIYCASKFALRGFAQALREECASAPVRVSLINPGAVRTRFFDSLDFEPGAEDAHAIAADDVAELVSRILDMRPGTVIDEINLSPHKRVWQKKN